MALEESCEYQGTEVNKKDFIQQWPQINKTQFTNLLKDFIQKRKNISWYKKLVKLKTWHIIDQKIWTCFSKILHQQDVTQQTIFERMVLFHTLHKNITQRHIFLTKDIPNLEDIHQSCKNLVDIKHWDA